MILRQVPREGVCDVAGCRRSSAVIYSQAIALFRSLGVDRAIELCDDCNERLWREVSAKENAHG